MKVREFSCTASSKRMCALSSCLFVCGFRPPFVSAGRAETRRVARGGMLLAKAAASEWSQKSVIKINLGLQAKKHPATRNRATARSALPAAFVVARQRAQRSWSRVSARSVRGCAPARAAAGQKSRAKIFLKYPLVTRTGVWYNSRCWKRCTPEWVTNLR